MRAAALLGAVVLASFTLTTRGMAAFSQPHRIGLIRSDGVTLRSGPSARSTVLARLVQQTQVEVTGRRGTWTRVLIWASVRGWIASRDVVYHRPWESVSTYRAPEIHHPIRPYPPHALHVRAVTTSPVSLVRRIGSPRTEILAGGARVSVTGWQQDERGRVWYRLGRLWALGSAIQFQPPDPRLTRKGSQPIAQPVTGKGMWLTLGTVADSAPDALVEAAVRNGISHLYLEAAISPLGFHGKQTVGPLIDAAHRAHLAVVAWVYPYLYDIAADVHLTRQVAAYRTLSGQRFDGIAEDLERNVTLDTVRAYCQLVRAYLGSAYLLVGVTYPPQAFPTYPFAEVAHDDNVLAPMDYWHQTKTATGLDYGGLRYGATYGYRYASDSVKTIRQAGVRVPIAPIGQVFDNFGRLEMGPHAPSSAEIDGFLTGAKQSGAVGVSFFQWMTATDAEWRSIRGFRY